MPGYRAGSLYRRTRGQAEQSEMSQVNRYEGRLDAIQRSMDTVHERLAGIEKTGKFLMKASVKEATPES